MLVALVAAGLTLVDSGNAFASDVACGAVITTDTTLHADLVNCPSNGIVIGADNITLDLNGHLIDGDGVLADVCPEGESCDTGVDNAAGYDGVTIVGVGSVRDFATGIFVLGATDNRVQGLSVSRNFFSGLVVGESARTRVEQNSIQANGLTTDQAGLVLFASRGSLIERNVVSGNGDIGLLAVDSSDQNRVVDNTFSDNPEAAMGMEGSGNVVSGNNVRRNGDGIVIVGNDNTIRGNIITDTLGCPDGCGYAISFEGGSNNVIMLNTIARTLRGIRVDAYAFAAVDTVIRGNVVSAASDDGIVINLEHVGSVRGTLIDGNLVSGAGDDGIDVESIRTTLARNVAVNNGDLGIEAVPGVNDGGGNRAAGNGDPRQCTNVDCSP